MRDTLTALAGVVVLILIAALAVPPFIDWTAHRALIDEAAGSSLGLSVHSEGKLDLRLLPSPRLQLERVQLGKGGADQPSLDAHDVQAEVALSPLLKGEFRFTETRIARAEMRLPVTESDALVVSPDIVKATTGRDLVIEDLRIQHFVVTTEVPGKGRSESVQAEGLQIRSPSLAGPYQVEGASGGLPFRVATSALTPDGAMTIKASAGGEGRPRFEADAKVTLKSLDPAAPRALTPEGEGSARLVVGPATKPGETRLPFSLSGKFKSSGPVARFESVNAEIDPAGQAARLTGTGRIDLRNWRAGLDLESRRLNLDALRSSSAGQNAISRALAGGIDLPIMLDLDLRAESMALGFEDWSDIAFKGTFDRTGGLVLKSFTGTAPGATKLDASGNLEIAPNPRFGGRLEAETANSEGLGRFLRKLGAEGPALALLDGRAFRLAGDLDASSDAVSLKSFALGLGEARLGGSASYTSAKGDKRGRFEAELDARGVDIAELPPLSGFLPGLERHDVGLKLSARDVRYGQGAASGNGRIGASIQSDGASLIVDSLDIRDLAGANAKLSGRIAPDGAGKIAGKISAPRAAPLLALLDRVWIAESQLLPRFLRDGALDLDVTLEREAGQAETLRTSARGKAAESTLDGSLLTRAGRIEALQASFAAPRATAWFGRDDIPGLRLPAKLTFSGARKRDSGDTEPHLELGFTGTVAGVNLTTLAPLALRPAPGPPDAGKLRIETADLTPFLALAGSVPAPGTPLPANVTLTLSRKGESGEGAFTGRIADADVSGSLMRNAEGVLSGKAALARLSLPALASALMLPTEARAGLVEPGWSNARFAPAPAYPRGDVAVTVASLDLGRGLVARDASFDLSLDDAALSLRNLTAKLAEGRLSGSTSLTRQGGNASISADGSLTDAAIPALVSEGPIRGRLSTTLRATATGDSPSALIQGLGGSGEMRLTDLTMPGADPGAIERALARALVEDDPLREGRVADILAEEFSAAPLAVKEPLTVPVTLSGGTLRSGPTTLDLGGARWAGTFALDLRHRRLDTRGSLTAATAPKGWSGGKPSVQLGFSGQFIAPQREFDAGPLSNGLAAVVLQRELEKIELADADQAERQRRRARIEMDKARTIAIKAEADRIAAEKAAAEKAAAEKAAKEKAAAEEAARIARARAQQAAAEEAARQARDREEAERRAREPEPSSPNRPPE